MPKFDMGYCGGEDAQGYSLHIHAHGCKAFKPTQFNEVEVFDGTVREAIDSFIDDEMKEMGWDESIVNVHNCAMLPIPC